MSKIEVTKCDGCGKLIEDSKDAYHLKLEGDEYWDIEGATRISKDLHFCWRCAQNIKTQLEKIAANMEAKE